MEKRGHGHRAKRQLTQVQLGIELGPRYTALRFYPSVGKKLTALSYILSKALAEDGRMLDDSHGYLMSSAQRSLFTEE